MRLVIIGQQDFGKATLEAFLARKDDVAAVFCAPEKPGARVDALKAAAQERSIPVLEFASLRRPEAHEAMTSLKADLAIMAFVLQFAPDSLVSIPRLGTIQYHPSLLPKYRGPSSINWPIIRGDARTGLTIFRPTEGLDEGPVVLQKECPIGPDDTLGDIYFKKLFPLGVEALLEASTQVFAGKHKETVQDESQASYEGWCREAEARVHWGHHVDAVYNLIRGCNPAPGAWTTFDGKKLELYDAKKHLFRRFSDVVGKVGEVSDVTDASFKVTAQGGRIEISRARAADGKKASGGDVAKALGLTPGTILGN